jgi:hypothetical protein
LKCKKQLTELYEKSVPVDFALLKLKEPVERPMYFKLSVGL